MPSLLNRKDCPSCKSSWDGGSILETFIKQRNDGVKCWEGFTDSDIELYVKEHYSIPYRWGRQIGIEIQGHYDGISQVKCPDCQKIFDRFTGKEIV